MTTEVLSPARTDSDLGARVVEEILAMLGRRRMRQAHLARELGVSPMWVSDRMTGRVRLTVDDLDRIARALGCGVVDLLPRDRRQVTVTYSPSTPVTVSGAVAHPRHSVLAGAAPIPGGVRRTAPITR